jgi:hypothetical protein
MITTTLSKEVLSKYLNPYFLETGTANGDCVRLALEIGFEKIFSIELDENLQNENIQKYQSFINEEKINLITGDSLWELINIIPSLDKSTTFWLDAHVDFGPMGTKRCPLYEELSAIKMSDIKTHTILIDDMRMLGQWWGEGISVDELKKRILEINPNYKFTFENGFAPNDILAAYL